jgi:hypothetical protein
MHLNPDMDYKNKKNKKQLWDTQLNQSKILTRSTTQT